MIQLVYEKKFYIAGKILDVVSCIRELASKYKTVREFLEQKASELEH
jgi:hypothetical protein